MPQQWADRRQADVPGWTKGAAPLAGTSSLEFKAPLGGDLDLLQQSIDLAPIP